MSTNIFRHNKKIVRFKAETHDLPKIFANVGRYFYRRAMVCFRDYYVFSCVSYSLEHLPTPVRFEKC